MWTWEQERRAQVREPDAQLGLVTLGGEETAVNLGGERRWLRVCAPGGMRWRPKEGSQVLVLKSGEEAWVLGVMAEGDSPDPGHVHLAGEGCALSLEQDIRITGNVELNGRRLEDYIRAIAADVMSGG